MCRTTTYGVRGNHNMERCLDGIDDALRGLEREFERAEAREENIKQFRVYVTSVFGETLRNHVRSFSGADSPLCRAVDGAITELLEELDKRWPVCAGCGTLLVKEPCAGVPLEERICIVCGG